MRAKNRGFYTTNAQTRMCATLAGRGSWKAAWIKALNYDFCFLTHVFTREEEREEPSSANPHHCLLTARHYL